MKRSILATVALIALLQVPHIARADLTYAIVNYPADQNGATLSGNIKTDGTIGALVSSNILSWTWTITPAVGTTTTVSSSDATAVTSLVGRDIIASQTKITVGTLGGIDDVDLFSHGGDFDLGYNRQPGALLAHYFGKIGGGDVAWTTQFPDMGGTDPWVIAEVGHAPAVPEPSMILVAGFGALGGIAFSLVRRCNAMG
jgi:hypothetical protein